MKITITLRVRALMRFAARRACAGAAAALLLAGANLMAATTTGTTVETLGGGPTYYNPTHYYGSSNSVFGTIYSQFHTPSGIAYDSFLDCLYVADRDNNAIREIDNPSDPTTSVTWTLAPYPPYIPTNLISQPVGVAVDDADNLYVLNRGKGTNGTVVEIDYYGNYITNATGLTNAAGIALDTLGDIFVTASNTVFKITPAGVRSVVATITNAGASLQGIVVKRNGSTAGQLAVSDTGRNGIYLIDPNTGNVTTNAGFNGPGDGTGINNRGIANASAKFFQPSGLAEAGDGSLIVADFGNNRVKLVAASGVTTNLYGVSSNLWWNNNGSTAYNGWSDGPVLEPDQSHDVQARMPFGVAIGSDATIYTTEDYYHIIREVTGANIQPPPPPPPPPPAPVIGTVSFPAPDFVSVLTPVTSFVFHNDVTIAIAGTNGTETFYTSGVTGTVSDPSTNSSTAPFYQDGLTFVADLGVTRYPDMTIKAITVNGNGESSPETSSRFQFVVANPTISGNNAAQVTVIDSTTNALMYYTIDGSEPTNNTLGTSIGPVSSGVTLSLQVPPGTNLTLKVRAFKANYRPSQSIPAVFTEANFVANTISFGFASGEASSDFVASPGQTFYAPVTLTTLPNTVMYSLQFNLTVNPGGTNPGPALASSPTPFGFTSMLVKPIPGITPTLYEQIPPAMFVDGQSVPNPITLDGSSNFSSLLVTNNSFNLLGVGWVERAGKTNLYDTTKQTLISYSIAHDDLFPNPSKPNDVIVGGYLFQVPTTATDGQTYQIQIGRPSATKDGIGAPGSSVFISAPTNGSLTAGAINAIKNVTIGSRKYLVGNAYPFRWFNAGDFGNNNLQNADVEQVFEAAVYYLNSPAFEAPGSDFLDAMDSCGNVGALDQNPADFNYGYWTNAAAYPYPFAYTVTNYTYIVDAATNLVSGSSNILTYAASIYIDSTPFTVYYTLTTNGPTWTNVVQQSITYTPPTYPNPYVPALFDGNDLNINQIAFGDGVLDVCDVYVTFRRSLDTNSLVWFQRFWTNGARVAWATNASAISLSSLKKLSLSKTPTTPPTVIYVAGDSQIPAGQTAQIPITASVLGSYPLRVAMLNVSVVPLDGSPALTSAVSFAPGSALGAPTSSFITSTGNGNYAAAWLNSGIAGISSNAIVGYLNVPIPAGATSLSAYAVHFDSASGSPNGLASLARQTMTGLITLSSRTNSAYHDGIPDSWRLRWFGTTNNLLSVSNACPSGDGVNNWKKYVAGVDPNTPNDFPSLNTKTPVPSGSKAAIHWPTVYGKQYIVLQSTSLFPGSWTTNATVTGTGGDMEYDDNSAGAVKFYQVRILP